MRDIFVISDTHFGHENILNFLTESGEKVRSFHDVHHMNEIMVENWNKVVGDSDIVYHLGDVYFGKGHEVLPRLKGRKRLIVGNHDNPKSEYLLNNFQKIMLWREFADFNCIMTHVPVHDSSLYRRRNLGSKPMICVHGHIHNNDSPPGPYFNVCVEKHNYAPISLEDIMKGKL